MNSSPQRHTPRVDEEAATWAARLEGDVLEAGERAELDAWLAQSPAHRAALSDYCQFSADLEEQLPRLVAAGAVKMPAPHGATPRRRWTLPVFTSVALAAAAALVVALWAGRPQSVEDFAVPVAQRATHTLADGTRVELNAHTSLHFENTKTERRARLAGGEAIFTVTKDRARPFIVETPAGSVRVTGTVFNVRTDPTAAFEVTVVEGSVEVRPAGSKSPYALTANQQLTTHDGKADVATLSAGALDDALAWRRGQIVFNDVPLSEAANRFAHFHGRTITIEPGIADDRVGGQYSLDDLSGFLRGVESALGVDVRIGTDGAVFVTPRQNR